jgi:hypothetical protein
VSPGFSASPPVNGREIVLARDMARRLHATAENNGPPVSSAMPWRVCATPDGLRLPKRVRASAPTVTGISPTCGRIFLPQLDYSASLKVEMSSKDRPPAAPPWASGSGLTPARRICGQLGVVERLSRCLITAWTASGARPAVGSQAEPLVRPVQRPSSLADGASESNPPRTKAHAAHV